MVLLVGTPYDIFSLDEEHRLQDVMRREYSCRDLGYVPAIDMASDLDQAYKMVKRTRYDLLVLFKPSPGPAEPQVLQSIRSENPSLLVACIISAGTERDRMSIQSMLDCDIRLSWEDDVDLFPALLTLADDLSFIRRSSGKVPPRSAIIILEEELRSFSRILIGAHKAVWDLTLRNMQQALSQEERLERTSRRPIIIGPPSKPGEGLPPWVRISCVFAPSLMRDDVQLSLLRDHGGALVLSREDLAAGIPERQMIGKFLYNALGMDPPVIGQGESVGPMRVEDLRDLEIVIGTLPSDNLRDVLREGAVRRWLMGTGEVELSDLLRTIGEQVTVTDRDRDTIVAAVRRRRYRGSGTSMMSYDRTNDKVGVLFSKIGSGAMGGKARALHFMGKLLEAEFHDKGYEDIMVRIPRTVVICTDMFERFLSENGLTYTELERLPDERIVQTFLSSDLPPILLGDLRSILDELDGPIVIRSSSLLEDALFQPFAGIYASVMLSNSQMERDQRFQNLCTAVKYVYSSTYLSRARAYIRSTDNDPSTERMSVMVQEVVGKKRGDHFYPAFSGVGRSFDYWPQGDCIASDGCANMAVGLGKIIVDGGASHRFCPVHPRSRAVASCSERLASSQRRFFAVRSFSRVKKTDFGEDSQLVLLDIDEADGHGILELAASTYSTENDRFYPGIGRDGPRAIDLAPILEEGAFPLAPLIKKVLDMGQRALGSPVEIEFALELEEGRPVFHLLQMRSMVAQGGGHTVEVGSGPGKVILECSRCLGNGINRLNDIVLVKDRELGDGPTAAIRREVSKINSQLQEEGRDYMLIGPGRWGSCDPWLGIPVSWNDISGVKVILETPADGRPIDPSQGSHFFQNITSLGLGYMMLSTDEDKKADWGHLLESFTIKEHGPVVHLRSSEPIEVRLDGRIGKGALLLLGQFENKDLGAVGKAR
jgi:hypothetical protein